MRTSLVQSAIYKILNIANGKLYIGSAAYITKRWSEHRANLRNNKHINRYLQASWNKHGEENFIFEIIELCDTVMLVEREQYWIDVIQCYNRDIGYNLSPTANSVLGVKHGLRKTPVSEETKRRMSEAQKGHIPTESQRKAVSEANKKRVGVKYKVDGCPTSRCKCEDCKEYKNKLRREARQKMKVTNPEKLIANDKKWKNNRDHVNFVMVPVEYKSVKVKG